MMLPREFDRRVRVYGTRREEDADAQWGQTLMIVNHIRGLMRMQSKKGRGPRSITLESLKRRGRMLSPEEAPTREEVEADWAKLDELRAARDRRKLEMARQ